MRQVQLDRPISRQVSVDASGAKDAWQQHQPLGRDTTWDKHVSLLMGTDGIHTYIYIYMYIYGNT